VTRANQYVDHTAPFKLAKDPAKAERLDEVLYNLAEVCRILAVLLWPFLPGTAAKINAQLGLSRRARQVLRGALGRAGGWPCHRHTGPACSRGRTPESFLDSSA
jgi:methionyl-tRNA synthetase